MSQIYGYSKQQIFSQLNDAKISNQFQKKLQKDGPDFLEMIKEGVQEVDSIQKSADKSATALATGQSENIHETMLEASKAELSFNLLVQLRNKVLDAYQEVLRMQI